MKVQAINLGRRMSRGGHSASLASLCTPPTHSDPNVTRRAAPVPSNGSGCPMRHRLGRLLMLGTGTALLLMDPAIAHDGQERSRWDLAHPKVELARAYAKKQKWYVRAHRQIRFNRDSAALSSADEHDLLLIARAAQVHRGIDGRVLRRRGGVQRHLPETALPGHPWPCNLLREHDS